MLVDLNSLINEDKNDVINVESEDIFELNPIEIVCECYDMYDELNTYECATTVMENVTNEDINIKIKLNCACKKIVETIKKMVEKIIQFFKSVGSFFKNLLTTVFEKVVNLLKKSQSKDLSEKAQYLLENLDSTTDEDAMDDFNNMPAYRKRNIRDAITKLEDALVQLCNSGKSGAAYMAAITENNNKKFIEVVANEVVEKNTVMKKAISTLVESYDKAKTNPEQATNMIKDVIYGSGSEKEYTMDNKLDYKENDMKGGNALIHFNTSLKISANTFEEIFIYWVGRTCKVTTDFTHPKNIHANLSKILKNYSASAIPNDVIDHASKLRKIIDSFIAENSKNINILTQVNSRLQSNSDGFVSHPNYRRFFGIGLKYIQGSEMVMYKINSGLMKYYSNLSNYINMITDTILSIDLPHRIAA